MMTKDFLLEAKKMFMQIDFLAGRRKKIFLLQREKSFYNNKQENTKNVRLGLGDVFLFL